jgi:hypothetical protein
MARLSLALPSGALLGGLSGSPWLGLWHSWFMYLGTVPDWGCYFTMAQPVHEPAGSHHDCNGEPRRGMFDWLVGKVDRIEAAPAAVRLMRDWCGLWLRGLVWLGPAGLGAMVAGWGPAIALGGGRRARSRSRFAPPHIHCIPGPLIYSVPLLFF